MADDDGRLRWSEIELCAKLFPGRTDIKPKHVKEWMAMLESAGLVMPYGDGRYAYHPNWRRHQYINRPTRSKLPEPLTDKLRESRSHSVSPHGPSVSVSVSDISSVEFGDLEDEVSLYLANLAGENKTGKVRVTKLQAHRLDLHRLLKEHGREAFAHGLRAANQAGVPNVRYVGKAAKSYSPMPTNNSRRQSSSDPYEGVARV